MTRYAADDLRGFATEALARTGLARDRAAIVAEVLLEGDLLGHDTHGLALLAPYVDELGNGRMATTGDPTVLSDRGAVAVWDGNRLPGPWLVRHALDLAVARAETYGTVTIAIRRSHHIACLAAYLEAVAAKGFVVLVLSSDPNGAMVAPFGGRRAAFTPNPIAAGWPTAAGPVLMDVSTSVTSASLVQRRHRAGERLARPWLLDAAGQPSDDPSALMGDPKGSILPLGGLEAGHKGYALGLLVEALTSGLAGHGRADPPAGAWGASATIQVLDPAAFSGREAFVRETTHLAEACLASPAIDEARPVRLPGSAGLARKAEQLAKGVRLHHEVPPRLAELAARFGLEPPRPKSG